MREDAHEQDDMPDAADRFDDDGRLSADLVAAGLLGAALGAGLGLLLSRLAPEPPPVPVAAWRNVSRAGRRTAKRARAFRDATSDTVDSIGGAVARGRDDVADRIEDQLRELKRLVRRGRRRGLFG